MREIFDSRMETCVIHIKQHPHYACVSTLADNGKHMVAPTRINALIVF